MPNGVVQEVIHHLRKLPAVKTDLTTATVELQRNVALARRERKALHKLE